METIEFTERDLLGGWLIEVRTSSGAHLGNIRRNPAIQGYSYFPGAANQLNASLSDTDLDSLKRKVVGRDGR